MAFFIINDARHYAYTEESKSENQPQQPVKLPPPIPKQETAMPQPISQPQQNIAAPLPLQAPPPLPGSQLNPPDQTNPSNHSVTPIPQNNLSFASPQIARRGEISFNFDDADVFDVVRTVFGEILKLNYMIDPKVKGRINFRTIAPVPKDEVLSIMEALLRINDAGFVLEKNIYRILPINDIPGTTPKVFVYPLQNSKATHIASLLQSILTGGSRVPLTQNRSVSTSAASSNLKSGSSIVASGNGFLVAAETRLIADEITNSLIILATPADYSFLEETIKKLDTVPRQVLIEALIAEVTLQDQLQFGIEWLMKTNLNLNINPLKNSDLKGFVGLNSDQLPDKLKGASGFSFFAIDSDGTVRGLLQALASDSKLNVLASPHIIAADNRDARIQIGDQVPIATSQTTQIGTSNSIMTTIQYKDTGIILKVKPQINESGLVALEIAQEVSDFIPQKILGTEQYIISKRETSTNLVAQDGQTVIIGGLIKNKKDRTQEGVPFLKDIPLLGYMFSSTKDTTVRTELLVMLTPHVIRNHKEAGEVTSGYVNRLKNISNDTKFNDFIKINNGNNNMGNKPKPD
jgi:type II secretory pathway component GspD/PulD (secretin)